jgi:nucleoside-diphosphate-sugar epimerase
VIYKVINLSTEWLIDSLPKEIDIIFHLAQSSRYKEFPEKAIDIFKVNTESTAKLLDFAEKTGVKKFIYFSTGGVYAPGFLDITENSPILPYNLLNYHFASKLSSELLIHSYSPIFKTTIFRPFFIYGKGQRRSMLLPRLVDQVKNGTPITIEGKEGLKINPIHVDDACQVILSVIENDHNGVFNLAGPEIISLKNICEKIGTKLGKKPIIQCVDKQPSDLVASIEKMSQYLYKPVISLEQGIEDILYE